MSDKTYTHFSFVIGSQGLLTLANTGFFLLALKWVDPVSMGIWATAQILINYGRIAHLGIYNTIHRDNPQLLAIGQETLANDQVRVGWLTAVTVPGAMLLLVFLPWMLIQRDFFGVYIYVPIVAAAMVAAMHVTNLTQYLHYIRHDGVRVAKGNALKGILVAASLWLVWRYEFVGMLLAYLIMEIGQAVYLARSLPSQPRSIVGEGMIGTMLRKGFPLWLLLLMMSLMTTVDRWLVLYFLGKESLGFYFPAIQLMILADLVPNSLMAIMAPKMGARFAEQKSYRALIRGTLEALGIIALLMAALALLGRLVLPELFQRAFPSYLPGLDAAMLILYVTIGRGLAAVLSSVLITAHRHWLLVAARLLSLGVNAAAITYFLKGGYGLSGVAWGWLVTSVVYVLVLGLCCLVIFVGNRPPRPWFLKEESGVGS